MNPPSDQDPRADPVAGAHPRAETSRVLVVDDEPLVREVVARYLEEDGHEVVVVADGKDALTELSRDRYGLVVLDLMLPSTDGLAVLRELRRTSDVPVILLTARGAEGDRVLGFDLGADDYVVKPFSPRELARRVASVLRRSGRSGGDHAPLRFEGLEIDDRTREVRLDGKVVALTRREFDLLFYLARAPRQVFSRAQLLQEVWDSSPEWQDPATVTVHIGHLRHKLEPDPSHPRWLVTVRGVGYRFEP